MLRGGELDEKLVKRMARNEFHAANLIQGLKKDAKLHKSLTVAARGDISDVLARVREKFNSSQECREGAQQAARETYLPGYEKHTALKQRKYCRFGKRENTFDILYKT